MATRRRWSQFLRARRLAIADELESARGQYRLRLVEELRLNDEFETTIDRRGRRTEAFMEDTYWGWISAHRVLEPLVPKRLKP
jgi:hypothetical protein